MASQDRPPPGASLEQRPLAARSEPGVAHTARAESQPAVGIITTDACDRIRSWDEAAERILGRPARQVIGWPLEEILVPSWTETRTALEPGAAGREMSGWRADRSSFRVGVTRAEVDVAGERIRILAIRDLSEQRRAEAERLETEARFRALVEQLERSLREKEVLLEEIHHRVKNNLQVISSLLRLQSAQVEDRTALELFAESSDRIHSMALVHEKLCESADLSQIDFANYVTSLNALLARSHPKAASAVVFETDVENISLDIGVVVPLGLIINELVSNGLKHAFPGGRSGRIRIELHGRGPGRFLLRITDDGVGFPEVLDFQHTKTLGMRLVCALTAQLGGTIELAPAERGADFRILFSS